MNFYGIGMCKFKDFPPTLHLIYLLERCPSAGRTYLDLWKSRNRSNRVHISSNKIPAKYDHWWERSDHDLYQLIKAGMISVFMNVEGWIIELIEV